MATFTFRRPKLYRKQREAIFSPKRHSIIEASTKSGKTVGCLAWLSEQAFVMPLGAGWNYWWIAPVYGQAEIAYRRLKRFLPAESYDTMGSNIIVLRHNGAMIWFKSADNPDSLYGDDVKACVIDEASRCKEGTWPAVRSTLTKTRGRARIIGNVKGRKNWAYKLARRAEADPADPEWHYARLTAYDAVAGGIFSQEELEGARRELSDDVFNELYLGIASDDAGNPFGLTYLKRCLQKGLSGEEPVVWGWDLAKKQNYTVGVGLDHNGHIAAFSRFQSSWEMTEQRILNESSHLPTLLDSTGVGDPIVERLQRSSTNFEGFLFTPTSKQKLMEGLVLSVQKGEIGVLDGPMYVEMESFEYVYTRTGVYYSAPEGMHDDCVMALALANRHYRTAYDPSVMISGIRVRM